jgi:hypothetical protein
MGVGSFAKTASDKAPNVELEDCPQYEFTQWPIKGVKGVFTPAAEAFELWAAEKRLRVRLTP